MDMEKKFYVYLHIRNDTGRVFYVGKGHKNRAYSLKNRNQHWKNVAAKGYVVKILHTDLTDHESCILEIETIKQYKDFGIELTNMTNGGDGRSGYKWTPQQIEKRTKSVLGKPRGNKGTKWTKDQRVNQSKVLTGKKHKDSKKVLDKNTGKIYDNAKEACLNLDLPWGSVYKMLKGERLNKTTLSYME